MSSPVSSAFGPALLDGFATVVLGVSFLLFGWAVSARRVAAGARPSVVWSGAFVVASFTATALFWLLTIFGLFRLALVLPLVAGLAYFALRGVERSGAGWRSRLGGDARAIVATGREVLRTPTGWVFGAVALLGTIALLRGVLAPPLGWDGLTYHLLKAGRYVQSGALVTERAPDAWQYYEYFPLGGDVLWAWALLPFRDGLLIVVMGVAQWAATWLGLYAAARELGASAKLATASAGSVVAMPAMVTMLSSGYVDNTAVAFFALGTVFLLRVLKGAVGEAPFVAAAFGCMVGTRLTTIPLVGLAGLVVIVAVVRHPWPWRRRAAVLALALAAGLVGAPTYLRAWLEHGSPFYPVRIELGGRVISAGEPELHDMLVSLIRISPSDNPSQPNWAALLYASEIGGWFANPGPCAVALALVALVGAGFLVWRRSWGALLWLAASALVMLGSLWTKEMEIYRVGAWAHTVGRLLLPGFAALALLGAAVAGSRWEKVVLALFTLAMALGVAWGLPRGLVREELPGLETLGGIVAVAALLLVFGVRRLRSASRPLLAGAAAGVILVLALAGTQLVRAAYRYPLYQVAARPEKPLYHFHPLWPSYVAAWPLWRELDRPEPLRLAVFGGWDGQGHNLYRFPLLGSRLQNLVYYVPITRDGSIVNTDDLDEVRDRADLPSWLGRLVATRTDVVVSLLPPTGVEAHWVKNAPQLFEPIIADTLGEATAYRFRRDRLAPGRPAQSSAPSINPSLR